MTPPVRGKPSAMMRAGGRPSSAAASRSTRRALSDGGGGAVDLAERAEPVAQLGGVQLRLLPGGEVPAAVDLVEVDEVGVRLLRPAPRGLVDLVGEDAHGDRDGDVLDGEVGALVPGQPLPV